jgi:outer membrane receptor for ferrienterochelin and colicins
MRRSTFSRPRTFITTATALASVFCAMPAFAQEPEENEEEEDVVVVQATRSGHRIQDEPIRVEVIGQEELEEKIMMIPGNISMIVAETGGVRVQVTSPALGAANVRMQGMSGRYTQLLADGLPLYGGQASSIGIMQIPPTDLGQVEVIKGSASALYGPSALGGVINLVSRRPDTEAESELLLNATSREGQDVTAYHASPLGGDWSWSVVGGLHRQTAQDQDADGWIDMPEYDRWTVRPRLFWESAEGASALITVGAMQEDRVGGTLPGAVVPDGSPFAQTQDSKRLDAGLVAEIPVTMAGTLHLRASGMTQDHRHGFGSVIEDDTHDTAFGEVSYSTSWDSTLLLAGLAYQVDGYASETFPGFDYEYSAPGLFAQVEQEIGEEVTLAASARWDDHSEFGDYFSPRLSALYRPGPWRVRASIGEGFYAPTPFVEEIEAAGLSRLEPLSGLRAETARTGSLDVGYAEGPFEASVTLFGSDIEDAVQLFEVDADTVRLVNADGVTRTRGAELLMRYRWDAFTVTGSYVHVDAKEPDPQTGLERTMPLTPHHTAGVVAMWEEHGIGRVGFELYYTGEQELDDNPFRAVSKPYFEMGLLGEMVLGNYRLFVNAENILNARQTRHDRLVRPTRSPSGSWTVDAWQPLDGFTVNAGVRISG